VVRDERAGGREAAVGYAIAASSEQNFRAITVVCPSVDAGEFVHLPQAAIDALMVAPGDSVICVRI
jgi:arginine N-succinyltransferase